MSAANKRKETDLMNLMMSNYKVEMPNDDKSKLKVEFHGPPDSLYQDGVWYVEVLLPPEYPYKPPSVRFINKIFHPNISGRDGSVCLDALKQCWSPMFDLVNIFEVFLPQLLQYPNADDPMNSAAGRLMHLNKVKYEQTVKEFCQQYAKAPDVVKKPEETADEELNDESGSEDEDTVARSPPS